jgi:hypothetical protein
MTCNKNWYIYFKEKHNGAHIYLGDDHYYQIKGYGDILVILLNGKLSDTFTMLCMSLG